MRHGVDDSGSRHFREATPSVRDRQLFSTWFIDI